ncbi:hypothetical protein [Polyangium mundeleinium]|uniref:Uncharacterized protein n=1 Tax=Polyangium mundeleinium TaxID=2995306 RepID=A0ABT5EMQ7_9BACT|nr:hypothetical protein [Polyangium mundeleinium]MDC0743115.1 hypothetical protein [Polyangium mundeleinium]
MFISIHVTKQQGKGAEGFLKALPELLKNSATWKFESSSPLQATIQHKGLDSLPAPPKYSFKEESAGSVSATLLDAKEWTEEQRAHALGMLVYLCTTSLSSHVSRVFIEVW